MTGTLAEAAARLKPARTRHGRDLPRLWLVSDPQRLPDPAPALHRAPRGAALLWRPYDLPPAEARTRGRRLRRLTRQRGVTFVVAGDVRLAAILGADGLHLSEGLARHGVLAAVLAWRHRKGGRLLTIASHGARALARAGDLDADAVLLSPAFPTASHPGAPTLGPVRVARLARAASCPVIALGGITPETARRLPPGAVSGLAAVGAWRPTPP
ncbi:thiamine phosphate synthase [Roseospira visakhapatnamensis]|uniref:Thiamine-phosphate pyrophosphorylase n=1 Tax=Roseospira visakhapatnamensis TaxID=390880 RepID=A0A7W6REB8_9PROT|nr:thiamine phosphate synthase [Roseospira visakhapatnamensis]MBB4266980.1 thiamine-phosphate pyrophosphorylase [Roseospira visakhapatnamensis]